MSKVNLTDEELASLGLAIDEVRARIKEEEGRIQIFLRRKGLTGAEIYDGISDAVASLRDLNTALAVLLDMRLGDKGPR